MPHDAGQPRHTIGIVWQSRVGWLVSEHIKDDHEPGKDLIGGEQYLVVDRLLRAVAAVTARGILVIPCRCSAPTSAKSAPRSRKITQTEWDIRNPPTAL